MNQGFHGHHKPNSSDSKSEMEDKGNAADFDWFVRRSDVSPVERRTGNRMGMAQGGRGFVTLVMISPGHGGLCKLPRNSRPQIWVTCINRAVLLPRLQFKGNFQRRLRRMLAYAARPHRTTP
jgi:hypothetical protein